MRARRSACAQSSQLAHTNGFDLIIMPTHAGLFRRTVLGSTTAKVLNEAVSPVLTTQHAETISARPVEHREWVCAIGLNTDSPKSSSVRQPSCEGCACGSHAR